ncbi:hypothetical protein EGW08_015479 [Elysia chlorotica]|uniref:PDZ domain-containing protein n=1 Tax=Elysia chlorotica TaxID=188477 RepID=A0A433T5C6_ELYCH|nr:hypothetical protein EGW08_015479 [Elysia chlorotica]
MSVTLTLTESPAETQRINGVKHTKKPVEEEEEDEEEEGARDAELVVFENTTHGLGLKICGGCSVDGNEEWGIFVKRVLPGGLAEASGEVEVGDQLLEVNGQNMQGITYDNAVSLLRQASLSNHVELVITRDGEARKQFEEYVVTYEPSVSPQHIVSDQGTVTDSDVELQRKMGSILQEAGFDRLNDSTDQSEYSYSGIVHRDRNGRISPSSSVNSEANQTVIAAKLPDSPNVFSNGRAGGAYYRRGTPTDSLNSLLSTRLSHEPGLKLHVSQLEAATTSLGLDITPSTQAALRRQLTLDADGRVTFSEFVAAARLVFRNQLEPGSLLSRRPHYANGTAHQASNASVPGDYQQVVRERDQLRDEVSRLREELRIRHQATQTAEDQLQFIRKQAHASIEECRALKIKLQLAEEAHAKAQQTESDYEEVVAMLENEVAQLRLQMSKSTIDKDGIIQLRIRNQAAQMVKDQSQLIRKATNANVPGDYHQVVRERDQLRDEVSRLREELRIRNQATQTAEDQLQFIRKQAHASIEECRALKIKLQLAEEAHAKAQQTESDYEEVVAMLENEVAQLRLQMSKSDAVNMQKRLAVLVCQLKKADMGKKTYEVATEKLTKFVEHSLDTLSALNSSPRLPTESNKLNKKKALQSLATDGREVIKTVRSLMESVPLPFGWEEAYTQEGVKYYIKRQHGLILCHVWSTRQPLALPSTIHSNSNNNNSKEMFIRSSSNNNIIKYHPHSNTHLPRKLSSHQRISQGPRAKNSRCRRSSNSSSKSSNSCKYNSNYNRISKPPRAQQQQQHHQSQIQKSRAVAS